MNDRTTDETHNLPFGSLYTQVARQAETQEIDRSVLFNQTDEKNLHYGLPLNPSPYSPAQTISNFGIYNTSPTAPSLGVPSNLVDTESFLKGLNKGT